MGFGLGACIRAKIAKKNSNCMNITGDGSFRINMNELLTAKRYNIPTVNIIFNNYSLGMVQ